ncbi:MAG: VWA domain-containing protein [Plesiomonas sp.]|uniref:VWA domain-containing protein n=1 Tax=Plesiomonas sp. TaxID=2486279 RepID=UPI003F3A754C
MPVRDPDVLNAALKQVERIVEHAEKQWLHAPLLQAQITRQPWLKGVLQREAERWKTRMSMVILHQNLSQTAIHSLGLFHSYETLDMGEFLTHLEALRLQIKGVALLESALKPLINAYKSHGSEKGLTELRREFMARWEQYLDQDILAEQIIWLDEARAVQLHALYQQMQRTAQLAQLVPLGEREQSGRLWDMADATLSRQEMTELAALAQWLSRQSALKTIAAELGRKAADAISAQQRQQAAPQRTIQKMPQPEEIAGIRFGRDLERLLTSSAIMLSVDELEFLFYKQLAEGQLLSYQLDGNTSAITPQHHRVPQLQPAGWVRGGPFIICVDTSGSMAGYPERCAKGMCLALMQQAIAQGRSCYVLIFSTHVICFELNGAHGMSHAKAFLSYRFLGGTDLNACIARALLLQKESAYHNADLIVLSDFITHRLSDSIIYQLAHLHQAGNRLHAISLSRHGNQCVMQYFDYHWQIDASLTGRMLQRVR